MCTVSHNVRTNPLPPSGSPRPSLADEQWLARVALLTTVGESTPPPSPERRPRARVYCLFARRRHGRPEMGRAAYFRFYGTARPEQWPQDGRPPRSCARPTEFLAGPRKRARFDPLPGSVWPRKNGPSANGFFRR